MKKIYLGLFIIISLLAACSKSGDKCNFVDSTLVAPATEIQALKTYLDTNAIVAVQHPSGFFYTITAAGTTGEAIVNLCSTVTVNYKGKLINGNIFDSTATGYPAAFQLGAVIPAWQKGLPLISKGGKIRLYIPPTLGYGNVDAKNNAGVVVIPANSILIFDIELLNIS